MKKLLVSFCLIFNLFALSAQTPAPIVFPDDTLLDYLDREVIFEQTLYVCGCFGNFFYLAPERLRSADETELFGTAAYDSVSQRNHNLIIPLYCPYLHSDTVRTGSTIQNLRATVSDTAYIVANQPVAVQPNVRPTTPPSVGDATITICCANLQHYCPDWEDSYSYATSDSDYQRQHSNIMKAFVNINADLYALEEVQRGHDALDSLVNGLNARTAPGRYAYVQDNDNEVSSFTKVAYLYRTDKLVPQFPLQHPYASASSYYHTNEYVQAFATLSDFETFVLSVNHFKAKDGTGSESTNAWRMENVKQLTKFLKAKQETNFFNDDDILIVGDLNCGTMEEPIRHLDSLGYLNQITRFDSASYSYIFDNQLCFLDHVFASPSMSEQITGVAVYHLNADECYTNSYSFGDTTMYRFADHDPILIGLRLGNAPGTDTTAIADYAVQPGKNPAAIYAHDDLLHVRSAQAGCLDVYDLLGSEILHREQVTEYCGHLPAGLYIVRFNHQVKKVLIR